MHALIPPLSACVEELTEALAAPFDPREVKFKPAAVSGNRALALAAVSKRRGNDPWGHAGNGGSNVA